MKKNWRLPKGVDELLPPAAWQLERLRRKVLDVFFAWGFEYIEPPVIEYLDSLLVGGGEDLDLQTLKVIDQVTGKQLGVRADMTSQAVRVDAHALVTDAVQRLCYAGNVVFANPRIAQHSRVPLKAGAELFGAPSLEADAEMVQLMLAAVAAAEIAMPVLLLGHMGIYRGLVNELVAVGDLHPDDEPHLFACVQRKSQADIAAVLPATPLAEMMVDLPLYIGAIDVLDRASDHLRDGPEASRRALEQLRELTDLILVSHPAADVRIDVAELSGYGYHNGPVFAVYHPQRGSALAQGGRYDNVGAGFGRPRPATGFDMDLKALVPQEVASDPVIFAPYVDSTQRESLLQFVAQLRQDGARVSVALSAAEEIPAATRQVVQNLEGKWQVVSREVK